jgi:hypothetical protein
MRPSIWGPILWNTMHIVSLGYPDDPASEVQHAATSFYNSLSFLIPCPVCRDHYTQHIREMPPAVESKKALVEWVWTLHNRVNRDIGKSEVSFDAFMNHMESLSYETSITMPILSGICIGIGISAAIYFMYRKH